MKATSGNNPNALEEKLQTLESCLNQLQDQLIRAQRLAALGTMAGMIAHEFNNLLTPVVSYAQFALKTEDHALWHKALTMAAQSGAKAADVAQQILGFARGATDQSEASIPDVVDSTLKSLVRDLSKDNIQLTLEVEPAVATIPPHLLHQVLYNLVINARQAMLGKAGRLTIRSKAADRQVSIEVADTGCGIDPEQLPRIFDPFFT
ncbi:MAG: hypothetical protein GXY33_05600, partial [Phycisphaerae bacterium]|nr:hypothetical protein [Phycisphaerae bacterium]